MDMKGILIWAVFILVCAAIILISRRIRKKINEEGIETDAVITRIVDASTDETYSYEVYVRYINSDGQETEALLLNDTAELCTGQRVRIKYHPDHPLNAVML